MPFPVKPVSNCGMHKDNNGAETVPTAGTQSDLVCYTRAELQRKIKDSLDITNECDELAKRYAALVKVCTQSE